uniref:ATP synthase F0 subunit 8 n=1 Tax=Acrobeloides nanus TaxID=290746 RepID=A0A914CHF9_9BILA
MSPEDIIAIFLILLILASILCLFFFCSLVPLHFQDSQRAIRMCMFKSRNTEQVHEMEQIPKTNEETSRMLFGHL